MHDEGYPPNLSETSNPVRLWSYELLRHAEVWTAIDENNRLDRGRIGSVMVPYYSPEHGAGWIDFHGPSRKELGRWLYGLHIRLSGLGEAFAPWERKLDRIFESFVDHDDLRREWRRSAAGGSTDHLRRLRASRSLDRERVRLRSFAARGLEVRLNHRLNGEERIFVHLAARELLPSRFRVCEQCALVFTGTKRARRCPGCQKRPLRVALNPAVDGGHHLDFHVGSRWASDDFDRTVYYTTRCQGCDRRFLTTDSRRRFCLNCGGGAGRVRRLRGSKSRTGRRCFRFSGVGPEPLTATSARGVDGQTISLIATDGVVETFDAEVAAQLAANPQLVRAASD